MTPLQKVALATSAGTLAGAAVYTASSFAYRTASDNADSPHWVSGLTFTDIEGTPHLKTTAGGFADHPGQLSLRCHQGPLLNLASPRPTADGSHTLRAVTHGLDDSPGAPITGAFNGHMGETPADFGCTYRELAIDGAPAWQVAPHAPHDAGVSGNVWAIHLHGHGSRRSQTLRGVGTLARRGVTSLVPTYRTSHDHPRPAAQSTLGRGEWQDLRAAHDYAVASGARHIVYLGWSLGAIHALRLISRHSREYVAGAILISPALDIPGIITSSLHRRGVPFPLARILTQMGGRIHRAHPGWSVHEEAQALARDPVPLLITQGTADRTVPPETTERFMAATGMQATVQLFAEAHHTLEWNADRGLWESTVADWWDCHITPQLRREDQTRQEEQRIL